MHSFFLTLYDTRCNILIRGKEMIEEGKDFKDCLDEQRFKMLYIKKRLQRQDNYVFCIETEETVKGFPDVMEVVSYDTNIAYFYEFKISDKNGKIKFQPTQPSFYRRHDKMNIEVVALNRRSGNVHRFNVSCLFQEGNGYKLNDKAEVML